MLTVSLDKFFRAGLVFYNEPDKAKMMLRSDGNVEGL